MIFITGICLTRNCSQSQLRSTKIAFEYFFITDITIFELAKIFVFAPAFKVPSTMMSQIFSGFHQILASSVSMILISLCLSFSSSDLCDQLYNQQADNVRQERKDYCQSIRVFVARSCDARRLCDNIRVIHEQTQQSDPHDFEL